LGYDTLTVVLSTCLMRKSSLLCALN